MPCHDQMDSDQVDLDELMFLQDCMGIDFQVAETMPELGSKDKSGCDFTPTIAVADYSTISAAQSAPRAPPLSRYLFLSEPSIVLTTQRFRI